MEDLCLLCGKCIKFDLLVAGLLQILFDVSFYPKWSNFEPAMRLILVSLQDLAMNHEILLMLSRKARVSS